MKDPSNTGTSKSIFTKLRGPFASKQHPQIKQEIHPDNPYREYAPGDSVKGKIVLDVEKPVRATHLVVRLHGFVKVVTHSRLPGEAIPYDENLLNSTKGRKAGEYFGNGFAKLFEDEHVLCGDGRLYGRYEFRFEVILPAKNIPSSIDFENGTITYSLTSTLTRPSTISPTLVEHYKLKVKENIDIARTAKPRPQTVTLETVKSRRPVMHMKRGFSGSTAGKETPGSQIGLSSTHAADPSSASEAPRSPGPSEIESIASRRSSNASNARSGTNFAPGTDTRSMSSGPLSLSSIDKTITAQTEVLQGGCLPGDTLNIKVSVDHIKPIKSMQGVLITFYRLGRIDTHPAIPLGPSNGSTNARYEDYYPKSRTGLGGLSLSSAGSSRTFRQDLSQNIAPLIVDPVTLTAVLRTSVNVPDHIFPTIGGVPGGMISFKYFIEVIIDLRGKLGQDRLATKLSLTATPQHSYEEPRVSLVDREDGVTFSSTPGFSFMVTDNVRRQKGVVFTKTEVLVGTRDSAKSNAKQKARDTAQIAESRQSSAQQSAYGQLPDYYSNGHFDSQGSENSHFPSNAREAQQERISFMPPMAAEEPLDEKARIRRAEMTLLPSAPPEDGPSSTTSEIGPSAPPALDEEDFQDRYNLRAPAPRYVAASSSSSKINDDGLPVATGYWANGYRENGSSSQASINAGVSQIGHAYPSNSHNHHKGDQLSSRSGRSTPISHDPNDNDARSQRFDEQPRRSIASPTTAEVAKQSNASHATLHEFETAPSSYGPSLDGPTATAASTAVARDQHTEVGNSKNHEYDASG